MKNNSKYNKRLVVKGGRGWCFSTANYQGFEVVGGCFEIDTCHLRMNVSRLTNSGMVILHHQVSTGIPPIFNQWSNSAAKLAKEV